MNTTKQTLSLHSKYWHKSEDNSSLTTQLTQKLAVPELIARLLSQKEMPLEAAQKFLEPKLKNHLPDPYHLLDMDKAVERTIQAIKNKDSIYVFGDYDVDGATSSSVLKRFFKSINIDIGIYIPDRIIEGYGPTTQAMHTLKSHGANLVFTVDCGATAYDAIHEASQIDLDIIILDHHLGSEELPNATAVVNPNRLDQITEYKDLAAVGVTFLFCIALLQKMREQKLLDGVQEPNLLSLLDLVALGTVCDVMPITGLNRAFVTQGLKVAAKRCNTGLTSLIDICNINEPLSCYHLGYVLGPRINAGGRVGKSDLGATLLSSNDIAESTKIATTLNHFNHDRQTIENSLLHEAELIAHEQHRRKILCITGESWHQGVIGIIASRMKEKFNKPTIVISFDETGTGKASCRSVRGFNLGKLVIDAREQGILAAGGGHAMAAGLTIMRDKLDAFLEYTEAQAAHHDFSLANIEEYNADLSLSAANLELALQLQQLAPFGPKNPEPLFCFQNISFKNIRVLNNKHVSALIVSSYNSNSSASIKAIAFNVATSDNLKKIVQPDITIIAAVKINHWQGRQTVQLVIKDIIA